MPKMKVARMIFTMLKRMPVMPIMPRIQIQAMNSGRNAIMLISNLPKENSKKAKTMNPQM